MICKQALQLSWQEVGFAIRQEMESILGKVIPCEAAPDDEDFWSVMFSSIRLTTSDVTLLINAVGYQDSLYKENVEGYDEPTHLGIGMYLSTALLARNLKLCWDGELITEKALTLVDITQPSQKSPAILYWNGKEINPAQLKSKQELLSFLTENGATHTSLMNFCEDYRNQYQDELCWSYPISDGLHLGTFLILVREGLLSLPYNSADPEDNEHFCLEDVKMFDSKTLQTFLEEWRAYSDELCRFMAAIKCFLQMEANYGKIET